MFARGADQQVKIRGYRVEFGEVDAQMGQMAEVAEVAEVAVVARPDGRSNKQLVAYVVWKRGAAGTAHPGRRCGSG